MSGKSDNLVASERDMIVRRDFKTVVRYRTYRVIQNCEGRERGRAERIV